MAGFALDHYSFAAIGVLVITAFFAGLGRGFSGFGSALIFMPLASAVIGAQMAAPLLLIIEMITAVGLIPGAVRIANKREVALMVIGSLLGVPLGTVFLLYADPLAIRWLIVGLIVPLLALMMAGWRYPRPPTAPVTTLVGGVAGFFGGVAQVGGPPIVLYWLRDATAAAVTRASFILYFAAADVIMIVAYLFGGLYTRSIIDLAIVVGPVFGIGLWIGSHIFGFASEATFRRVCYGLIAASALASLPLFDGLFR
jgi:uncharacterized membrane protein YfcA